ncbi:MAG: hypothetical protein ACLRZ9_02085 [Eubacterium sp.]
MIKFYEEFDGIDFMYSLDEKEKNYADKYRKIEEIHSAYWFSELTKMEYNDIQDNLDLIYADKKISDDVVKLFDLIRNKVIDQYLNIEGLERLYSEKYVDFEWDMHLGIDFKKHKMGGYRDHFIHQVKNAYCIHVLLDKFEVLENVQNVLKEQGNSKISRYVSRCIKQQMHQGYYYGHEDLEEYNKEEFYLRNIIYMSSYMAALLHDIGYPESNNTVNQRRITEYIANLYNTETSGYNYVRLNALLQNSLLFRVVPFTEIKGKLSKDRPDHGALSAVMFLLNFYENGAIQGLQPFKKCAVELAALAMYNHTNDYSYKNEVKTGGYIRNSFLLNPISYLLRLVDDLQEWGRIYFELTNRQKLIICSECKSPIMRKKDVQGNSFFVCNCQKQTTDQGTFYLMFEPDGNFPYRRICNVTVCENMMIQKNNDRLYFYLDYSLDKLLNIAYINPNFAKGRVKDLNLLKEMLDYQPELPQMKLGYFVTANLILIKVQILGQYLKNHIKEMRNLGKFAGQYDREEKYGIAADEKERAEILSEWNTANNDIKACLKNEIVNLLDQLYPEETTSCKIRGELNMAIDLYLELLICMEMHKDINQRSAVEKTSFFDGKFFLLYAKEREILNQYTDDELNGLIKDCIKQFCYMYEDIREIKSNPHNYYKQFESDDYTYGCIKRFLSGQRYVPVIQRENISIDAYTDMALFREMLQINSKKPASQ